MTVSMVTFFFIEPMTVGKYTIQSNENIPTATWGKVDYPNATLLSFAHEANVIIACLKLHIWQDQNDTGSKSNFNQKLFGHLGPTQ